ncbi:Uncharacterised protein [Raoultella ornithinolytica]|nr:Uncharacterised protein [Raoultella ornithinolytica]
MKPIWASHCLTARLAIPTLTPQGEQVLSYVKAILAASNRLDELAISLSDETEARLTFVLSDTLHPDVLEDLLQQFDRRFPHTEFECLIGEDEDVIDLLQKERAQVGLIEARDSYPTEIGSTGCRYKRRWPFTSLPRIRWRRRDGSPGMSCIAGENCA